jgi:hypothetical protein
VTMKTGVFWVLTRATRRNNPEDTILQWNTSTGRVFYWDRPGVICGRLIGTVS